MLELSNRILKIENMHHQMDNFSRKVEIKKVKEMLEMENSYRDEEWIISKLDTANGSIKRKLEKRKEQSRR